MKRRTILSFLGLLPVIDWKSLFGQSKDLPAVEKTVVLKLRKRKSGLSPGTGAIVEIPPSKYNSFVTPYVTIRVTRDDYGNYTSIEECTNVLDTNVDILLERNQGVFAIPTGDYKRGMVTKEWLDSIWSLRDCVAPLSCPEGKSCSIL